MADEQKYPHHAASRLEMGNQIHIGSLNDPTSDMEIFAKEVLGALIMDNLPPTPNNFTLYFDRILEDKSDSLRRQIGAVLELEESNDDEKNIELEKTLKQGFSSVKSVLQLSTTLYKNMMLMEKILDKRREEMKNTPSLAVANDLISSLGNDVSKLGGILKKQVSHMKELYNETANIVKQVENETIFDDQYGVYNKRYLINKLTQEMHLIEEFRHKSSLVLVSLSHTTLAQISSDKAKGLMVRTVARLLLKTSRRSDTVAHYGEGVFAMMLKHTDIESAKKASERLFDLVSSTNFFLGEQEISLRIAIGVIELNPAHSVEHTVVTTLDAMEAANNETKNRYVISSAQ
ncbi:MAG: diguanylate cyclase [Sulfuricurvum sp.]|uniref:GGDEF domain-containing protein n=1 Tax=Sulfuricurvum sp. TaxID=2025608 RepID=UPI0026325A5B|nr:diguanylate cyclase [Sulfuricurvum sp.]MDD2828404.1 diguanylate cyclase [Sulfuricurvum sp.]MDD4949409.1 diguanylate cyclase [Sulfuricurvum sp.]